MSATIKVGISDLNVARSPDILMTYALGSCVGICLYDKVNKVGGLSHIMLPVSTATHGAVQPYRFADTAIPVLVQKVVALGANRRFLTAKIAGGARMFSAGGANSSLSNIGQRNVVAVKEALAKLAIPIIAEDTGRDYGRTLYFNTEDGVMHIKSAKCGEWDW